MSYETNRIEEFLTTFGRPRASPSSPSPTKELFLSLDGTVLTLRHFPATDDLVLASTVAKRPEGEAERLALCEKALKMNAFSRETGEGVLGLLPTLGPRLQRVGSTRQAFLRRLEALLLKTADRVAKLRKAFAETGDVPAEPADLSWMQGPGVLSV